VDIFRLTSRPDISYFYKSDDKKDLRLGSLVKSNPLSYDDATFVLVGYPSDLGGQNEERGVSQGPDAVRKALYRLAYPRELEGPGFFDLGNIILEDTIEMCHEKLYNVVKRLLEDQKTVIVLGGSSDISYPDLKALLETSSDISAINVNNKYNVNEGEISNETPYRILLDEGKIQAKYLIHLGIQPAANSYHYHQYLKEKGSQIIYQREIKLGGLKSVFDRVRTATLGRALFWGFDMNVLSSSDAPGVYTVTPTGISADDVVELARFAGALPNSKIIEISEFNPKLDVDNRTARLVAMMIIHFVSKRVL
jgi:formiminoglutamase